MSKHTPGPWRPRFAGQFRIIIDGTTRPQDAGVASVEAYGDTLSETEKADALLIAAAPDLAAALTRCMSHIAANAKNANYPRTREAYEIARAALSKAGVAT